MTIDYICIYLFNAMLEVIVHCDGRCYHQVRYYHKTINTVSLFVTTNLIGGAFTGTISQWLRLKTSLILFSQLWTLGAMLLVCAHDCVSMIIARTLTGICNSVCILCVPMYNLQIPSEYMKLFYGEC